MDEEPRPRRRIAPWLVGGLVILLVAALAAVNSPLFGLDTIEVAGQQRSDVRGRVADIGVGEGALLVWIDTDAVAAAVVADPWVAHVRVAREFPNRLRIEVVERTPTLAVGGLVGWMIVASDGVVTEVVAEPPEGLPLVRWSVDAVAAGTRPLDSVWDEFVDFAVALEGLGPTILEKRDGEWWAMVDGTEIRLGAPISFRDKTLTARALIDAGVPDGWVVDVVSPIRPTLVDPNPQEPVEGSDS